MQSITEQQVCPHALPQYAVLAKELLTRLCSNTKSTMDDKGSPCLYAHNCISNSAILNK